MFFRNVLAKKEHLSKLVFCDAASKSGCFDQKIYSGVRIVGVALSVEQFLCASV